jgi:hypothetical protein
MHTCSFSTFLFLSLHLCILHACFYVARLASISRQRTTATSIASPSSGVVLDSTRLQPQLRPTTETVQGPADAPCRRVWPFIHLLSPACVFYLHSVCAIVIQLQVECWIPVVDLAQLDHVFTSHSMRSVKHLICNYACLS